MADLFDDLGIVQGGGAKNPGGDLFDSLNISAPTKPKSSIARRALGDTAISALKGAIGLTEAPVGLADIATGGHLGKGLESLGYRPKEAKAALDDLYSPEQKAANQAVQEAKGFTGTLKAAAQNPSTIAQTVIESAPLLLPGAGVARGLGAATKLAPAIAGGIGEGVVGAGLAAEQMRQNSDDGLLSGRQTAAALASGAGTAAVGAAAGKLTQSAIGKKLGLADVDTALAMNPAQRAAMQQGQGSIAKRALGGAVSEGVLEELPQSMWEQAAQNYGEGKDLGEGVGEAGALGMLAGGLMGGGFNAAQGLAGREQKPASQDEQKDSKPQLLPPPTYTGISPDRVTENEAQRANAVAEAEAMNAALWAARDEYEAAKIEGRRPVPVLITDPAPLQQRINEMFGVDQSALSPKERKHYAKQFQRALDEQVAITNDENGLEVPLTMADYLESQVQNADAARWIPFRDAATRSAEARAQQLQDEESFSQPDIQPAKLPEVGPLSAAVNVGIDHGATTLNPTQSEVINAPSQLDATSNQGWGSDGGRGAGNAPALPGVEAGGNAYAGAPVPGMRADSSVGNAGSARGALNAAQSEQVAHEAAQANGAQAAPILPQVKAQPLPPIMRREDLVGAILRVTGGAGIASNMAPTIVGDKANQATKIRGLFQNAGTMDLDDTADLLRTQEGYDVRDGAHLAELIRQQADGVSVRSMNRIEQDAAEKAQQEHKDWVLSRAQELGLKGVGGKRTLAVVEAEIAQVEADIEAKELAVSEMEARAERAAIQAEAVYDEIFGADLSESDWMSWLSSSIVGTYTQEEIDNVERIQADREDARAAANADAAARFGAQESIGGRQGPGRDEAPTGGTQARARGNSEGFGLSGQTNEEAAADFARLQSGDQEGVTREQADRERDAVPFSLGEQSQPKPQGVQSGLFTADGRVSKEAVAENEAVADSVVDQAAAIDPIEPEATVELKKLTPAEKDLFEKSRIADFGAKIEGARKDKSRPIGTRAKIEREEDKRPAWARKYVAMQVMEGRFAKPESVGKWQVFEKVASGSRSGGVKNLSRQLFDTEQEALDALPLLVVAKRHRVREYQPRNSTAKKYGIFRDITERKSALVRGNFSSRDEATQFMANNPVEIIEHKFATPDRPWLDRIERIGANRLEGDVTTDMFQKTFGFRGGQFGNWNMGGDGQAALNHAYEALLDLADAIGVPPKALSLDGQLAIAFGARGQGGKNSASAHYEPDTVVINLTKIKGAGSLAHEWWHAVDHYFTQTSGKGGYSVVENGYSSSRATARPDLVAAIKRVVDSMMYSERSQTTDADMIRERAQKRIDEAKQTVDYHNGDLRGNLTDGRYNRGKKTAAKEQLAQWDAMIERLKSGDMGEQVYIENPSKMRGAMGFQTGAVLRDMNALYKSVTGRSFLRQDADSVGRRLHWTVESIKDNTDRLGTKEDVTTTQKGRSNFLIEAARIDNEHTTDYWSTPHEMGARAFESYIFDKIAAQGNRSDYLVHGVDNRFYAAMDLYPYPEGEERQRINAAFDHLFETVQARETERGVAMESRANINEPRAPFRPQMHERYEQILNDTIADFESGSRARIQDAGNRPIPIGRTPVVLRQIVEANGSNPFKRSEFVVGQGSTLYLKSQDIHGKSSHGAKVGLEILRQLPELLADPAAVFKSSEESSDPNSFKVLLDTKGDGDRPIIVAIKPNARIKSLGDAQAHWQATIFPSSWDSVSAWNKLGLLRYVNEESQAVRVVGNNTRESGSETERTRLGFDSSIGREASKVKVITKSDILSLPSAAYSVSSLRAIEDMKPLTQTQQLLTKVIEKTVDQFKGEYAGAEALDIRVVYSRDQIPARYRPSPYAEGVYHDREGIIYLVAQNLPGGKKRAWQVLMHEVVGHYGLANMMGSEFSGIWQTVLDKAKASERLDRDPQPGERNYETVEAVRRLYPEASDAEVAQEVLARMAESMPKTGWFQMVMLKIRKWMNDVAEAFGLKRDVTLEDVRNLVKLAGYHIESGANIEQDQMGQEGAFASQRTAESRTSAIDMAGEAIDRMRSLGRALTGEETKRAVDSFDDLDPVQRKYMGKIGANSKAKSADVIRSTLDRAGLKIRQGLVDRYAALKELDEKAHGKRFLDTAVTQSAWVLAKMSSAGAGALHAMMSSGRITLDKEQRVITMKDSDGGLISVLKKLGPPEEVERWFGWIAANRAEKLMTEGREHLFTPDEIAAGKRMNQGKTAEGKPRSILYAEVYAQFNKFRDDVVGIAEQAGIISAEERAMWKDEFYVPFYRVMEEEEAKGPRASKGLSRQEAYKKLKGGTEKLNDLMENTLMNFHHLLSASLKNQAAAQAIKNAVKMEIARKVPEARRDTANSTFVLEGGKRVFYEIDDPLVFESITALSDPGLNNTAVRLMSAFKRVFTNMTTITPQFVLANTFRDLLQASATSPISKNIAANASQGIKAYRDEKTRAEMLASGAAFSFGHIYGASSDEIQAALRKNVTGAELVSDSSMIPKLLRKAWKSWGDIADTSENISRAAAYTQNVETHGRLRAAFEARDVMDFSQHGAFPAVRFLIRVVPFLNARLQGLDKLYRSGAKPALLVAMGKGTESDRAAAARFATVTGALVLASMALYMANADDDEYEKLEDWQKDSTWPIRIGNQWFFLPKPFEVGSIATMAERTLQQFMDDKATGKLFKERMWEMLMQTFSFNPTPQLFQPMIDVYANKDAFTGRPIETAGMERLSKGLRENERTTIAAKTVSAATRAFGDDMPFAVSPAQADHLIKGYLGAVGANAAGMIDTIWRTANGKEAPAAYFSENPVIKRFYRDLDIPMANSRYSTLFYDGLKQANQVYADVMELQKLGQQEDATELRMKHQSLLQARHMLNAEQRALGELNKQIKEVYRSDMDGELKRQKLDRLNAMKALRTERAGKIIEEIQAR